MLLHVRPLAAPSGELGSAHCEADLVGKDRDGRRDNYAFLQVTPTGSLYNVGESRDQIIKLQKLIIYVEIFETQDRTVLHIHASLVISVYVYTHVPG